MNRFTKLALLTPLAAAMLPSITLADTTSDIAALRERLEQLEAQVAQQKATPPPTTSSGVQFGDTTFSFGGYIKVDALYSRYSNGAVAGSSSGRDFYVPSTTPISAGIGNSSSVFDMHAQQTRFFFKTETSAGDGKSVKGNIEMDFQSPARGSERVTNNYDPGLRHAFLTYDKWLAGQTWTTFQDLGALLETVDFVGASDGTTFGRQPQVRYSNGNWQFSAENAETAVAGITAGAVTITDSGSNAMPDLVARYTRKGDFGHISVAALARQLKVSNNLSGANKTAEGYGISLSGKYQLSSGDDIRYMTTYGSGIGRYVALGTSADAVVAANGDLEAIDVAAGYITYRHLWTEKLRSSIQASILAVDNPDILAPTAAASDANKTIYSGLTNIIYSVTPKLDIGAEYLHANREVEDSRDGSLDRLQFMAKYSF
ncbi:MAG: DcaP family trimeric outer membrane transporter [Paraperlucidibaca sp.]